MGNPPQQQEWIRRIVQATRSYLQDYAIPLVATARRDPAAARTVAATDEGRERMHDIRAEFDRFLAASVAWRRRTNVARTRPLSGPSSPRGSALAGRPCSSSCSPPT